MRLRPAVFFDRDGVLNRAMLENGAPRPPRTSQEIMFISEAKPALENLRKTGFLNIVVTNQPDVARGKTSREFVEALHRELAEQLPVDAIYVCWHDDADHCDCRKPQPGMLLQGARDFGINLHASYMVEDRWRDIEAGRRAGCATIFIDHGYETEKTAGKVDFVTDHVGHAAKWILERQSTKT